MRISSAVCREETAFEADTPSPNVLLAELARLSDDELAALEDELDFYAFTGIESSRITQLLGLLVASDVLPFQKP